MIHFGKLELNDLNFGNRNVIYVHFGPTKVYPAEHSITLPGTGATMDYSQTGVTMTITATTTSWTVSSNVAWLTVTKLSNNSVRYSVEENEMYDTRTGVISFMIGGVVYATYTITQTGAALSIVVSPMNTSITKDADSGYVTVTCNSTAWTMTYSGSGFTASKTSQTRIDWTFEENTGNISRTGYINVSCGGQSVIASVYQASGYYLEILSQDPYPVSYDSSSFNLSVISRLDNQAIQPTVTITNNNINAAVVSVVEGGSTGQFNYTFSCDTNGGQSARTASITFTLDAAGLSDSITIKQSTSWFNWEDYGYVAKAKSGDWYLLWKATGSTTTDPVTQETVPVGYAAILSNSEPSANVTASANFVYTSGFNNSQMTPTTSTYNNSMTISTSEHVVVDGTTFYGRTITGGPNFTINYVNSFSVE